MKPHELKPDACDCMACRVGRTIFASGSVVANDMADALAHNTAIMLACLPSHVARVTWESFQKSVAELEADMRRAVIEGSESLPIESVWTPKPS